MKYHALFVILEKAAKFESELCPEYVIMVFIAYA